jgi:uncharacterized protein
MTPEELANLNSLLEQLVRIRGVRKDPAADALIQRALEQQPDAGYLLVQRILMLEQAIDQAKAQIAAVESRARAAGVASVPANEPGALARGMALETPAAPAGQRETLGNRPVQTPTAAADAPRNSWLGNVASTAAGVAAGAFLFQGIESLLGHGTPGWGGTHHAPEAADANRFVESDSQERDKQDDLGQLAEDDSFIDADDDSGSGFGDDSDFV